MLHTFTFGNYYNINDAIFLLMHTKFRSLILQLYCFALNKRAHLMSFECDDKCKSLKNGEAMFEKHYEERTYQ